jgi:hypothetical protein
MNPAPFPPFLNLTGIALIGRDTESYAVHL